jgi:hypothetical protein
MGVPPGKFKRFDYQLDKEGAANIEQPQTFVEFEGASTSL